MVILIHYRSAQEERLESVNLFKRGERDVLIATDVASKGLDFPDVQHVINFDMPKDIESYGMRADVVSSCSAVSQCS